MLLYLMRHGIAQDRDDPEAPPDPDRALTRKGVERTEEVVRGLRVLGVDPELIVTSPYRRAVETAALAARGLGVDDRRVVESEALLPDCAPGELFADLDARGAAEVLCVGHAPGVDELLAFALGGGGVPVTALKKAGVACLFVETLAAPRGRLCWLLEPGALRALGRAGKAARLGQHRAKRKGKGKSKGRSKSKGKGKAAASPARRRSARTKTAGEPPATPAGARSRKRAPRARGEK